MKKRFLFVVVMSFSLVSCGGGSPTMPTKKTITKPKRNVVISPSMIRLLSQSQMNNIISESKKIMIRHNKVKCIAYATNANVFHTKLSANSDCSGSLNKAATYKKTNITTGAEIVNYAIKNMVTLSQKL